MKKHISVLSLYLRAAFPWLLLTMLLMAVGQIGAFYVMDLHSARYFFSEMTELKIGFVAGCVAMYCVCIGSSQKHSKFAYTLQRLRISEWQVFLWHCVANTLVFVIVWFWEILIVFFLSGVYASFPTYHHGTQGILAAFYRSRFYHGLFPLEEVCIWIRNLVFLAVSGVACSYGSLLARLGKKPFLTVAVPVFLMQCFETGVGDGRVSGMIISGILLAVGVGMVMAAKAICHNGKEAYENEEIL